MESSKGTALGVVAVVIAVVAITIVLIGGKTSAPAPAQNVDQNAGGERAGLQEFKDGIKAGDLGSKWITKTLPPLTTQVKLYCNTTGRDTILDYGSVLVKTGETASSTSKVSIFATTTTDTIAATNDFATIAEGRRALLQALTISTSTTASSTSSVYAARVNQGNGAVVVANNSCVWGYLQQDTTACSSAGAVAGAACETATSSNRGFNPIFNIRIHTTDPSATSI